MKQSILARKTAHRNPLTRLGCAALVLLAALSWATPIVAAETPPPDPLCFEGPADYIYSDGRVWINIQKRFVSEPKALTYFVCDVQTNDPMALKAALSGDEPYGPREGTADIALRCDARLAINGDCYSFHRTSIIVRNGEVLRAKRSGAHHLLMLDTQGDLSVITDRGKEDPEAVVSELLAGGAVQVWAFGPALVRDGVVASYENFSLISVRSSIREPRTAIGQVGPLHYVVVVADGRRDGYSEGMTLSELQQVFLDAGAVTAFNLDGGGSTTLFFCGEVLNRPSGGGERSVSDILYF